MLPLPVLDVALGVAGAALAAAMGWLAYLVAVLVVPEARISVRWSAAATTGLWAPVALFWLLTPLHAFRLPVVLVLGIAAAAILHRSVSRRQRPADRLRADLRDLWAFAGRLGRLERWLGAAIGALAAVRFLRALASPPLAWDDLTYHLVRAGRWVQAGGYLELSAPDAWGSYRYFGAVGEILWAWAMLPLRADALVAPATLLVWALVPLAIYAGARELSAGPGSAFLASLTVASMPAVLAYVSSAYVDNVTLACAALGSVFVIRLLRGGPIREAPLALAALALAAGTKLPGLPLFVLGWAAVLVALARNASRRRARAAVLVAGLLVSLVCLPTYVRAWLEQGSPLYPFHVQVAGIELSQGNRQAAELAREILEEPSYRYSELDSLRFLLGRPTPSGAFLNPGLAAPILLLLALAAVPALRGGRLLPGLFLWAVALYFLGMYVSPVMELFRTTFMVSTSGRYITPAFAALAVLAALGSGSGRLHRILWTVAVAWSAAFAIPRGWSSAGVRAIAGATALVAVLVLALAGVAAVLRRADGGGGRVPARRLGAVVAVLLLMGGAAAGLLPLRRAHRYPIYRAAADPADPAFQLHPLHSLYASAWPLWERFDRPAEGDRPRVLAVTAGFEERGHNWYVYPLLGSRLQNRVVYAPVTRSGAVLDYRDPRELERHLGQSCWLGRLRDAQVDAVVTLAPRTTVEDVWIGSLPDLFQPVIATRGDRHGAYRLDREALRGVPVERYCASSGAAAPSATS